MKDRRLQSRLQSETDYHIDRVTEDYIAQGLAPQEARRRALLAFGGATQIQLPAPNPLDTFAFLSYASPDLYLAFRSTNGLNVSGSASIVGSNYVGSLTYVISKSYGFNAGDTSLGAGPAMRYLQTICGAPYYPGGAHWFPLTVTISEPFTLPR